MKNKFAVFFSIAAITLLLYVVGYQHEKHLQNMQYYYDSWSTRPCIVADKLQSIESVGNLRTSQTYTNYRVLCVDKTVHSVNIEQFMQAIIYLYDPIYVMIISLFK